jgi:hypothetical protein
VDYYALSFVRDAAVIYELKNYLAKQGEGNMDVWRRGGWCSDARPFHPALLLLGMGFHDFRRAGIPSWQLVSCPPPHLQA